MSFGMPGKDCKSDRAAFINYPTMSNEQNSVIRLLEKQSGLGKMSEALNCPTKLFGMIRPLGGKLYMSAIQNSSTTQRKEHK